MSEKPGRKFIHPPLSKKILPFFLAFLMVFQMAQPGWILCLKKNRIALKTSSVCCCTCEEEQDRTLERVEEKDHSPFCSCCVKMPFVAEPSKIQKASKNMESLWPFHGVELFYLSSVLPKGDLKGPPPPILPLLHTLLHTFLSTVILLI